MAQMLKPGVEYQLPSEKRLTAVTQLSNEANLQYLIQTYRKVGYQTSFRTEVLQWQAELVANLRTAHVDVTDDDEAHLLKVCGVHCRGVENCVHILTKDELEAPSSTSAIVCLSEDEQRNRMIVCCDPIQTKLRDDAMECFPRHNKATAREELVVRVHLFYPNDVPCGSRYDQRARLVTQKQFVPRDARRSQGYHVFHYASRGAKHAPVPAYESMFPNTEKGQDYQGFTVERKCTALTVETVFVRDATRQQQPFYAEDTTQTRVYVSYLRASELVTDDQLSARYPPDALDSTAMPAFAEDRDEEKFHVLMRLYLLARDQGWAPALAAKSPHPLHNARLPPLFRSVSTEVDVPRRADANPVAVLKQQLVPDLESQITRFCFRHVVSEELRRRIVVRAADDPAHHVPVVCYMPYGDRVPAFTDAQIAVLTTLYKSLDISKPASAEEWCALSRKLYRHDVPLLDILQAVGKPLLDKHGAAIAADAYVPYTADMAHTYFVVVANRPLRDYTCVVNQRWLVAELLGRRCESGTTRAAFAAWVRYWDAMVHLKHELEEQLSTDIVSAHLGQRLPTGARGQCATCLVNGRVTDCSGGLVFAELCGQRFTDATHVGHLPPGTAVVYLFRWSGRKLSFEYVPRPYEYVRELARYEANPEKAAQRRAAERRRQLTRSWYDEVPEEPGAAAGGSSASGGDTLGHGSDEEEEQRAVVVAEAAPLPAVAATSLPHSFMTTRRVGLGSLGYGATLRTGLVALPAGYRAPEPEQPERPPSPPSAAHSDEKARSEWRGGGATRGGSGGGQQRAPYNAQRQPQEPRSRGSGSAGGQRGNMRDPRRRENLGDGYDDDGGAARSASRQPAASTAGGRDDCFYDPGYVSAICAQVAYRGSGRGGQRGKR